MLLSTRCSSCNGKANGTTCDKISCSKNWEGSSKGMESQAALIGAKEIYDRSKGKVRLKNVCGDDDSSFRKVLKSENDGGKLEEKYGKISVCSDLSHRLKNMTKRIYDLEKMAKAKSTVNNRLAKSLDIGVRASARKNCSKELPIFQSSMKGSILHTFNVHSLCDESYCTIMYSRMEYWRQWYLFDFLSRQSDYARCLPEGILDTISPPFDHLHTDNNKTMNDISLHNLDNKHETEMTLFMMMDKKVSFKIFCAWC